MPKPTISKLKKKLDTVFSLYIRKKYADHREYVECVTCKVKKPIKEMQNGHYVSRGNNSLRFSEDNCFPQCVGCNVFKKGNYPAYTSFLINKFGSDHVLNLEKKGREIKQFTIQELQDLIKRYSL